MGSLVPERRTNKNGVTSTKWVRPTTSGTTSKKLPAPSAQAAPPRISAPLLEKLHHHGPLGSTLISVDRFDQRAVRAVEKMLTRTGNEGGMLDFHASKEVKDALKDIHDAVFDPDSVYDEDDNSVYAPINNVAAFGDALFISDCGSIELPMLVRGVSRYKRFEGITDFLLETDDEERKIATALVVVAARIKQPFIIDEYGGPEDDFDTYDEDLDPLDDNTRIASPKLVDFIMERPESAEDIAKVINERQTDDVDVIREILDHGQQSLRSGLL